MSRGTFRIGCQDGHFDALAHIHDQSPRTGVVVAEVRIFRFEYFTYDRIDSQGKSTHSSRTVGLVSKSSDLERLAPLNTASIVFLFYFMITPTWTTPLNSHARQPAEHRVALVARLGVNTPEVSTSESRGSSSRFRVPYARPDSEQRAFRIAAAQEISSRRAARSR